MNFSHDLERLVNKSMDGLDKAIAKYDERVLQRLGPNQRSIADQSEKIKGLMNKQKLR